MPETLSAEQHGSFLDDPRPVWAFDLDRSRLLWANSAAFDFWGAALSEQLRSCEIACASSPVIERLRSVWDHGESDGWLSESWTLSPRGRPKPVVVDLRGYHSTEHTNIVVVKVARALRTSDTDVDDMRMMQAALALPVGVSVFDRSGQLVVENAAATTMRWQHLEWNAAARRLRSRYGDELAGRVLGVLDDGIPQRFRFDLGDRGNRRHLLVTATQIRDRVTGDPVVVVADQDLTVATAIDATESTPPLTEPRPAPKPSSDARSGGQSPAGDSSDLQVLIDAIPIPMLYKVCGGEILGCNALGGEFLGVDRTTIIGATFEHLLDAEAAAALRFVEDEILATGRSREFPVRATSRTGEVRDVICRMAPFELPDGRQVLLVTGSDTAGASTAQEQLRTREATLRAAEAANQIAFVVYDNLTRDVDYISELYQDLLGVTDDELAALEQSIDSRFGVVRGELDSGNEAIVAEAEARDEPFEISFQLAGGPRAGRWIRARSTPLSGFEPGSNKRATLLQDITDQVVMEQRMRHVEKLEAVGKLTGGVAHDFNNLLAVVQGNAELLKHAGGDGQHLVDGIISAAARGAALTNRLLAFARRQELVPAPLDLAEHCAAVLPVLRRTLGPEFSISMSAESGLWLANADADRLSDVIVNLAINARDAMPDGGDLVIELANAASPDRRPERGIPIDDDLTEHADATDFVVLRLIDAGTGMGADVLAQAMDPFFTTKPVGEGTGLGLSTAYGFARQSGGDLSISSEVGVGTVVTLSLPRARGASVVSAPVVDRGEAPLGRGERVLVVEDDEAVRRMMSDTLLTLNYVPVDFESADPVLDHLRTGQTADLLLTDVVLPGLRGPALAEVVRAEFPSIAIVFMSGYPELAAKERFSAAPDSVLLRKPIERSTLAIALRDQLEAR